MYIGLGRRGRFFAEEKPANPAYTHFHKLFAESPAAGHGGGAGPPGERTAVARRSATRTGDSSLSSPAIAVPRRRPSNPEMIRQRAGSSVASTTELYIICPVLTRLTSRTVALTGR